MNADQLLADGLDQQCGNDGGVDTTGQSQQHLLVANLCADLGDLLFDERIGQFEIGNTLHGFGTYIARHRFSLQ